jgi:hypothetical protein
VNKFDQKFIVDILAGTFRIVEILAGTETPTEVICPDDGEPSEGRFGVEREESLELEVVFGIIRIKAEILELGKRVLTIAICEGGDQVENSKTRWEFV